MLAELAVRSSRTSSKRKEIIINRVELPDGDGGHLVVFDARYGELQYLALQVEGYTLSRLQELDGFHLHTLRQLHPDSLRAERVDRLHPSMVGVGVSVVEQMHGISGCGLPTEHLDEPFTFNVDDALVAGDPAD